VLALAPDAASQRAAQGLASPRSWHASGAVPPAPGGTGQNGAHQGEEPGALWGECAGSAAVPYRTMVDLSGPAYRCSCPSRKFPCKHALALLLLWSDGHIGVQRENPPGWATSWLNGRAARTSRGSAAAPPEDPKDPAAAQRRAQQREARVASGLAELDRWLCDQVRQGLAGTQRAGYRHWDAIAARMVDAQAPGVAERLRALAAVPYSGGGWEGRLLEEYALLRLLATAYRRSAELPGALRDTVRSRIGFTVRQADVLAAGVSVTDRWHVLGRRDLEQERVRTRRVWLRGQRTGRAALVLSFAASGEPLDGSLRTGTELAAELAYYPAALPLRAVVVSREQQAAAPPPPGQTVAAALASWAAALAEDPWLDTWPAVLEGVVPARSPAPCLADAHGDALPLHPGAADRWPLFAVSGGHPVTVAGEWTPRGLWPLTAWTGTGPAVQL